MIFGFLIITDPFLTADTQNFDEHTRIIRPVRRSLKIATYNTFKYLQFCFCNFKIIFLIKFILCKLQFYLIATDSLNKILSCSTILA